jgi:hypothetical protein
MGIYTAKSTVSVEEDWLRTTQLLRCGKMIRESIIGFQSLHRAQKALTYCTKDKY